MVTENGNVSREVQSRAIEAGKAMGGMNKIFQNREMGMEAKKGLYESVIVPTALYGSETWCSKQMTKTDWTSGK